MTAPRSVSRPSRVDTVRTSIRARAAIAPVVDGCQRSITAIYTRRSVFAKTSILLRKYSVCSSINVTSSSINWRKDRCCPNPATITRRRGLPPVRISSGRISRLLTVSPLITCHRSRHSSVDNGSSSTRRNSSKNGSCASSSPLKRLMAVASSIIWGSDCRTPRSFQPKSPSTSLQSDCRFSTMSTSFFPSRSAASRTAARVCSSSVCSPQRPARAVCVSRNSRANSGLRASLSLARWNSVSSQKSARVKISWLSSMNRTGNRLPERSG